MVGGGAALTRRVRGTCRVGRRRLLRDLQTRQRASLSHRGRAAGTAPSACGLPERPVPVRLVATARCESGWRTRSTPSLAPGRPGVRAYGRPRRDLRDAVEADRAASGIIVIR